MLNEDKNNDFLCMLEKMLSEYFLLTKKYLVEKNAKLEMLMKIKKMKQVKEEMVKGQLEDEGDQEKQEEQKYEIGDEPSEDSGEDDIPLDDDEEEVDENEKLEKIQSTENDKQKYIIQCTRVLRLLQLMCEGHFTPLQNHLKIQMTPAGTRNSNSIDFIAKCSNMLSIYCKSYVNRYSTNFGN